MHTRDPFVVESWTTQAVQQDLATMDAYGKGDVANGDIFSNAANETRRKIERYELDSKL